MNTATNLTLLQYFAYIMSLALYNPNSPPPLASPPPPEDDYDLPSQKEDGDSTYCPPLSRSGKNGEGKKRGVTCQRGSDNKWRNQTDTKGQQRAAGDELPKGPLRLESFGWRIFDMIDVFGNGRCGPVFRAVFRGEDVAVKLCDLWQHPDYEKKCLPK
jgi:hypothetical protein